MAEQTHTTSRRGMLAAFAVAPVAFGLPVAAKAASAGAFAHALALYRKARADERAFDRTYMEPAGMAANRAEDAIPHTSAILAGREVTTRRYQDVDLCRRARAAMREEYHPADLAAADLIVQAAEKRLETVNSLPERIYFDEVIAHSDELCNLRCRARDAAIALPVANVSELAAKLDLMEEEEMFDPLADKSDAMREQLRSDMRLLAKGGLN